MKQIESQFGNPRGMMGHLVGVIMARENRRRNLWALSLLDLHATDRVLEIGFGPGWAIQQVSRIVRGGLVAGVDRSTTMLKQAQTRNRAGIKAGHVVLRAGSAAKIPYESENFDKVYAVNSFHEWEDSSAGLAEASRVLKPGGLLLIIEHPHGNPDTKMIQKVQNEIVGQLSQIGFSCEPETRIIQGRVAIAVIARN